MRWLVLLVLTALAQGPAQAQLTAKIEAGALGGNVREGPAVSSKRVARLKQGERVLLLENAGVELNGYPWFKIEFRAGRTGHVWGGILCARQVPVAGLRSQCEGYQLTTGSVTTIPVPTRSRMVHYQCSDGSHLIVRYETRGKTRTAVYSHDGYPEIRLAEVESEQGEAYSNGKHVLRAAGKRAVLRGRNRRMVCAEP
ncbi:MAG: SH3 domain-containing protein [Pseudomonadota bacterium]